MNGWWKGGVILIFLVSTVAGFTASSLVVTDAAEEGETAEVKEPNVTLIVLDGADWKPINQLREAGRVPTFTRFMEEGAYGVLLTPKAFSPITWTKIGTGREAEDLNVDSWQVESDNNRIVQSGDVKHRRVWDYLNAADIRTGITNYFLTWPVSPVNGFIIASIAAQRNTDMQHPEDFIDHELLVQRDEWTIAHAVFNRTNGGEGYPFTTFGFKGLDAIQHSLWKFLVPDKFDVEEGPQQRRLRNIIYREYERTDRFMRRFNDSRNVILVSDSGFEADGGFQARTLEQFYNGSAQTGFIYPTYEGNLEPLIRELWYGHDSTDIRWCSIDYPRPDHLNATAYLFQLCINDNAINVSAAVDRLKQVRYRNGKHFFENVHYNTTDEVIRGRWRLFESGVVDTAVRRQKSHQPTFAGSIPEVRKILGLRLPNGAPFNLDIGPEKSGDHPGNTHGIFLAHGPAISERGETTVRAVDVAPTILYMYNLPIPRAMDGRPVTEMFTQEFNAERTVRYRNISTRRDSAWISAVDEAQVSALRERLKGIGYLD